MTATAKACAEPPCLTAALDYARRGWSVIPLRPKDKRPLVKWEAYETTRATEGEIREWWARWPTANVGIVTGAVSGLVVIDIDGEKGAESAKALPGAKNVKAPVVETGRGTHVYCRHPGGSVPNSAGNLPGIDVRGDGGYVVAPPSVHPNGQEYAFMEGFGLDNAPADPALLAPLLGNKDAPNGGCVVNFSDAKPQAAVSTIDRYAASALEREIGKVVTADDGTRNNTLNEAAFNLGQLIGRGDLHRNEVELRLLTAAQRAGLSDDEARRTIEGGITAGMAKPREPRAPGRAIGAPREPFTINLDDYWLDRLTAGPPPERKWLIRGAVPLAVPVVIYGPGGVGKSMAILDLCLKVATRHSMGPVADPLTFLGPVPAEAAGAAVFITLEDDTEELHRRTAALDPHVHRNGAPFLVIPGLDIPAFDPVLIRQEGKLAALTHYAKEGLNKLLTDVSKGAGVPVRVLAFDPAGDFMEGSEDDAAVVKPLMRQLRAIAARNGCTVILIGHTAKTQNEGDSVVARGMRGSGAWTANARAAFGLWRPKYEESAGMLRNLEIEVTSANIDRVVFGKLQKSNAPTALGGIRKYLQDQNSGLPIDCTDGLRNKTKDESAIAEQVLVAACGAAAKAGLPFKLSGGEGSLYKGRADLPPPLNGFGERKLIALGNKVLDSGALVKCRAKGSRSPLWFDVPGGPLASGATVEAAFGSRSEALLAAGLSQG